MIVLRKGEELKRRYPGSIRDLGIGRGTLYFTDRRVCFESDKKGMCLQVYYDKLYNWTRKKRSIVLRWREPKPGEEIRVGDPKFDVEVELDASKFNGDPLTVWEVSKSLYYQVVKYHRIGWEGAGMYLDDYSNIYHWWWDREHEQVNPVVPVKKGTKMGQPKDLYDKKDLFAYKDGKLIGSKPVIFNDVMQGEQWTKLSYCWKKYVGFENTYVDEYIDNLIGNRTEKRTFEEYEKEADGPIPVHGSLLEQDMVENVKVWKFLSDQLKIDTVTGQIKEESGGTKERAVEFNNKHKKTEKNAVENWTRNLKELEQANNTKELKKIYPANAYGWNGGTIYDMVEYVKKVQPALVRMRDILQDKMDKGLIKSMSEYDGTAHQLFRILAPMALDGKDVSQADPGVMVLSEINAAYKDARRFRRHLIETV